MGRIKKGYQQLSMPAKATIWFTICNFIIKGMGFITVPIFTRLLATDEYGILSVYMSYEQLFIILATWEMQLGAYQKGLFKYKDDVDNYTTATQAIINILTIACFFIVWIFHRKITSFTKMPTIILWGVFVNLLFFPAYTCWLNRQRKNYNYKAGVSVTLLYCLACVITPIIAIILLDKTAIVKFGFSLVASVIICFCFFIKHANYWTLLRNKALTIAYWKYNLKFEAPLVLHSLSYLILSQADRVMISEMVGPSQAAYYSVAYTVASVVTLFQSSINSSLAPWRYQMLEEKKYKLIRVVTNELLIVFGVIIVFFVLIAPECMKILFPLDYFEAVWCIAPVSAGAFFIFIYSIFVNIEEYYEKTQYVVLVSFSCGVINVILNYICIGVFGYIACAYTTLFSYILFALGHYFFMMKTLRKEGITEDIVDGKTILQVSIILTTVAVVLTVMYPLPLFRYMSLIVCLAIGFTKRKRIVVIVNEMRSKVK